MPLSRSVSNLFFFFLYYISFEWTVFSIFKDYDTIQQVRFLIDALPLILLITYMLFVNHKLKVYEFKVFAGFILLLLLALLSLIIEKNNPGAVIENMGVTIRYLPFMFFARIAGKDFISRFLLNIKIVFIIQILLTILEYINKSTFINIFLPNSVMFGIALPTAYWDQSISTTFINTIEYSFFILSLALIIIFSEKGIIIRWTVFIITFIMSVISNSVATILCLIFPAYFLVKQKWLFAFFFIMFSVFVVINNKSIIRSFTKNEIKTFSQYIEISNDYNRIGYFTKLLPEFFTGNFKDILLGIGIDNSLVKKKFSSYKDLPLMLKENDNKLILLKDVYWVSVIILQGVIAFSIFIWMLWFLSGYAKKKLEGDNYFLVLTFILVVIFLGFFNQIMDIKSFSFCFWTVIGLTFNISYLKNTEKAGISNM